MQLSRHFPEKPFQAPKILFKSPKLIGQKSLSYVWRAPPVRHLWTRSLIFARHQSIFSCDTKLFKLIQHIFICNRNHFYKHVFLFCATINTFSQHESSFGCNIIYFVDTTVFCATQDFFMLRNVSMKNIMNEEKQMCSH